MMGVSDEYYSSSHHHHYIRGGFGQTSALPDHPWIDELSLFGQICLGY